MDRKILLIVKMQSFRPLTGTLLSKKLAWKEAKNMEEVSVPSRGLSYLKQMETLEERYGIEVSVPSRGLSYLK